MKLREQYQKVFAQAFEREHFVKDTIALLTRTRCANSGLMDIAYVRMRLTFHYDDPGFVSKREQSCLKHTAAALHYLERPEWQRTRLVTSGGGDGGVDRLPIGSDSNKSGNGGAGEGGAGAEGEMSANFESKSSSTNIKNSVALRVVMYVAMRRGELPSRDDIAYHLARVVFEDSMLDPLRFVVISIKRVLPGIKPVPPSSDEIYCPDLVSESGSDGGSLLKLRSAQNLNLKTLKKRQVEPQNMVAEVRLLICGSCAPLRERRWLCDVLQRERLALQKMQDSEGVEYLDRVLQHHTATTPVVDENIISLMIDRLRSPLFDELLTNTSTQSQRAIRVDELQRLLGPTFAALREVILAGSFEDRHHASASRKGFFLENCTRYGISLEHSQMVACLPEQTLDDFESQLNALKERHGDGSGASYNESVNRLVSSAVSGLFLQAREHLLEQLQDPVFQKWVREHRKAFLEGGLSNPRNRALHAAPDYPLSAVFAFFVQTAGQDLALGVHQMETHQILAHLIALGNGQLSEATENGRLGMGSRAAASGLGASVGFCEEAAAAAVGEESDDARKRRVLKLFQTKVHKAITLYNNPSIENTSVLRLHRGGGGVDPNSGASFQQTEMAMLSVEEDTPLAFKSKRKSTHFVVARAADQAAAAITYHRLHQASFVPTIVFISCALAMLLVVRAFIFHLLDMQTTVAWLHSIVTFLNDSCDQVTPSFPASNLLFIYICISVSHLSSPVSSLSFSFRLISVFGHLLK